MTTHEKSDLVIMYEDGPSSAKCWCHCPDGPCEHNKLVKPALIMEEKPNIAEAIAFCGLCFTALACEIWGDGGGGLWVLVVLWGLFGDFKICKKYDDPENIHTSLGKNNSPHHKSCLREYDHKRHLKRRLQSGLINN